MTTTELQAVLDAHAAWLRGEGGEPANLRGANLSAADLSNADLSNADLRRASLIGANLSGADLSGADLSYANLSYADLSRANFRDADLRYANLSRANFRDADLRYANLSAANFRDADLRYADLSRANFRDADLSNADLRRANLSRADLSNADLSSAKGLPLRTPCIASIDAAILAAIGAEGANLTMDSWHAVGDCGTTHCRAGWAVTLAGDAGALLEELLGTNAAAALIYNASRPGKRVPDFFASNIEALASIQADAAEEAAT